MHVQNQNVCEKMMQTSACMSILWVLNLVIDFLQKLKYLSKTVSGGLQ